MTSNMTSNTAILSLLATRGSDLRAIVLRSLASAQGYGSCPEQMPAPLAARILPQVDAALIATPWSLYRVVEGYPVYSAGIGASPMTTPPSRGEDGVWLAATFSTAYTAEYEGPERRQADIAALRQCAGELRAGAEIVALRTRFGHIDSMAQSVVWRLDPGPIAIYYEALAAQMEAELPAIEAAWIAVLTA